MVALRSLTDNLDQKINTSLLLGSCVLISIGTILNAEPLRKNGFALNNALIPIAEIHSGGPGKDGIPAIDHPQFITATDAEKLQTNDRVLGLHYQGITKAYPVKILNWHEIVNDDFNGRPVAVTFCPLCGSGIAYAAVFNGKKSSLGVSGLLYNSDVLLYDRETESLWSQLMNQAVAGPLSGMKLKTLALTHTTWADWKKRYPNTLILSEQTGFSRNYQQNPYKNYHLDKKIWFPVANYSSRYHPKELVLGIELNDQTKVYPFSELTKMPKTFKDELGQQKLTIKFNRQHQTAAIYDQEQQEIPTVITFWFAWYAFHPHTILFEAE